LLAWDTSWYNLSLSLCTHLQICNKYFYSSHSEHVAMCLMSRCCYTFSIQH
jgi:hypothetical protein